jgi:ABC-type xylose transport system permease subunit
MTFICFTLYPKNKITCKYNIFLILLIIVLIFLFTFVMKKIVFEQMVVINGGQDAFSSTVDYIDTDDFVFKNKDCLVACLAALATGTGGVIATAITGGGGIPFAIAANWIAWGSAAYSCGRSSGKF